MIELTGVYAQYRIGPRLDEVVATGLFEGNVDMQLPPGPWIISSYWRMTPTCRAAIEAAIPSFSKGVRWSSMAAVVMLLGITIAFDVARLVAAKASGQVGEPEGFEDYCKGCCGGREPEERLDEDDEGCLKECLGCAEDGPCASLCDDPETDSDDDSRSSHSSRSKRSSITSDGSASLVDTEGESDLDEDAKSSTSNESRAKEAKSEDEAESKHLGEDKDESK